MIPEENVAGSRNPNAPNPTPHSRPERTQEPAESEYLFSPDVDEDHEPALSPVLQVRRIDPPIDGQADPDTQSKDEEERQEPASNPGSVVQRPDPIVQSVMLLLTMAVMLLAAKYAIPSIVEEIRYAWHRGELRAEYESGTEGLKNVSLDALSEAYQMVTAAVGPSVVHIEVERRSPVEDSNMARLLAAEFVPSADQGSGVVVDQAGYILTNRHVILDGAEIKVTLSDGRRVPAQVVGTDALTDLALLKVQAEGLMPIAWGDSERCRVGSPVWAVGSPFGLDRTVTFGILSGKHRKVRASTQYQDFMQSDVAVNPGNSGGPLVDARGTLVGINTAIVGDTYQGVSFSIPSSVAKEVYERLRENGFVARGWLGVALSEVPDDRLIGNDPLVRGAMVTAMADRGSPAFDAGIKPNDVIVAVDGESIRDMGHLMRVIAGSMADTTVQLKIHRDGEESVVAVRLHARPAEFNAQ